ncbi:MAG: type II toxin-antitoxin system VapC family toxin [Candidatus Wildermuthbacteria bacterium]|nr:type II toxin-antitoxin system VapC family toxin [Candidatus Wildermuthbacteria bacterium]
MEKRSNRLFVDSNFFVALFNKQDALAERADEISRALDENPRVLVISNLVFLEIVTVISVRVGRQVAKEVGSSLLLRPDVRIVHVDEDLHEESWKIFQETEGKNISFVDCSIAAVMRAEGISALLTFDRKDFKGFGKHCQLSFYA